MGRVCLLLIALMLVPSVLAASILIPPDGFNPSIVIGEERQYTLTFKGGDEAQDAELFVRSANKRVLIEGKEIYKSTVSFTEPLQVKTVTVKVKGVSAGVEEITYGLLLSESGTMFKKSIADKFQVSITGAGEPPAPYCGDGKCQSTESCSSCRTDCGSCPSSGSSGGGGGGGGGGGVSPYYSNWTRPNRTVYNSTPVQPEKSPDLPLPPTTEQSLAGQEAIIQDLTPGDSALSEMAVDTRPSRGVREEVFEGGEPVLVGQEVTESGSALSEMMSKKGFIPIVVVFGLLLLLGVVTVLTYREVSSW